MFKFLKEDLRVVKKELNLELLKEKDEDGYILLQCLFYYTNSLDVVKYVFKMYKLHFPELFSKKDNFGRTIIDKLFFYNNYKSLPIIKYALNFFKKHYHNLFIEKYNEREKILYYSYSFLNCILTNSRQLSLKYVFNFYMRNFPSFFLILKAFIIDYSSFSLNYIILYEIISTFYKYNFPEKSVNTNNFILPLMMEIQN